MYFLAAGIVLLIVIIAVVISGKKEKKPCLKKMVMTTGGPVVLMAGECHPEDVPTCPKGEYDAASKLCYECPAGTQRNAGVPILDPKACTGTCQELYSHIKDRDVFVGSPSDCYACPKGLQHDMPGKPDCVVKGNTCAGAYQSLVPPGMSLPFSDGNVCISCPAGDPSKGVKPWSRNYSVPRDSPKACSYPGKCEDFNGFMVGDDCVSCPADFTRKGDKCCMKSTCGNSVAMRMKINKLYGVTGDDLLKVKTYHIGNNCYSCPPGFQLPASLDISGPTPCRDPSGAQANRPIDVLGPTVVDPDLKFRTYLPGHVYGPFRTDGEKLGPFTRATIPILE